MNANAGISANLVMQGGRNGDLLQGNLIADDNNAVKLFLEESVVLENQNILGNIVVQRDSGRQALYTLRNHQNRLVFRMLQREPTQSEIGEHRCFFRKVISPNEDIAYEVAYKANNFDMKTFVSGRIGNAKSKFNPKKAGDGRAKDYYYTFKYNSTQIQFLRKINKERERFNMKTFFLNNGDDKFSIYVNKRNGPSGRYDKKQGADTRSFNTPAYKQNFVQYIPIIPQTNRGYEPINYGRPLNNGFRGKRGPTNNGRFVGNSRFGPKESFGGSPNGRSMFVKPNGFNGDYDKNMRSYPARGGYGTQFTGSGQFNRPRGGYGYNSQQNGRFNEDGRRFMDFDSGSRGYQGFMRSSRY